MAERRSHATGHVDPAGEDPSAEGRAILVDIAVVLGVFLVAGLLVGAVWPQLVDPVTMTRTQAGIGADEAALSHRISYDGWYSALGGASGLVLGVVLTAWRRTHEVVTVLMVTAGALLAALVAARTGTWWGPEDPQLVLAKARPGATAPAMVRVSAQAAYLLWPITALVGAVVVLWSPPGSRLWHRRGAQHKGESPSGEERSRQEVSPTEVAAPPSQS